MKKFTQVLALVFTLAFGYGLGQHTQDLFATDYPRGGSGGGTHPVNLATDVTGELPHGSTSDDAAQVHGLGASVNVLGNLDASGEFIQRNDFDPLVVSSGTNLTYEQSGDRTITFGTAFSNTPYVMIAGSTDASSRSWFTVFALSTTTVLARTYDPNDSENPSNGRFVALGD